MAPYPLIPQRIISLLQENRLVFKAMLEAVPEGLYHWRPEAGKWCILEIVCHLLDEEREDFRPRVQLALNHGKGDLISINPVGWVLERDYKGQDYAIMLQRFLEERDLSSDWLESLENPDWTGAFQHSDLGKMSAHQLLANWLAHDYHHIRQINSLKYSWLKKYSGEDLSYAGNWLA